MELVSEKCLHSVGHFFPISNTDELFTFVTEFILAKNSKITDKDNSDRGNQDANIALLSIVLGLIEHSLTIEAEEFRQKIQAGTINNPSTEINNYKSSYNFPPVELDVVVAFYRQFQNVVLSYVDLSEHWARLGTYSVQPLRNNKLISSCESDKVLNDTSVGVAMEADLMGCPDSVNNNLSEPHKFNPKSVNLKNSAASNSFYCTKGLLKCVSDSIWVRLQKSYQKDRSHQQSLFSFLTTWRLDSFGVAVCVVAAAQLLGLNDVHLALSEDHAWVTFGENQSESAEVTWHGKAVEDKRGESITEAVAKKRWLYLGGKNAIKCDRASEVAACIASMSMNMGSGNEKTDSSIVAFIQQKLLWYMYHEGLLDNYPTCIALLGDLEDIQPYESCEFSPLELYQRAIRSSVVYYADSFVYPYIHLGKHCLRKERPRESLANWARAATVIGRYNYDKEEEEIYREFFDIATVHIPSVVRRPLLKDSPDKSSQLVCEDPISLCYIIQFIDGICCWEEGSSTPVLHISWAEKFLPVISAFSFEVRKRVVYLTNDSLSDHRHNEDQRSNSSAMCSPNVEMADSQSVASNLEKKSDLNAILQEMSQNMFSPLCHLGAPDSLSQPSLVRVCEASNKIEVRIFSRKMALICELIQNEKFNPQTANLQLTAQTSLNSERKRVKHSPYVDFTYLTSKRKK